MNAPLDWLLAGEPWIAYRTRLDLLGETDRHPAVDLTRHAMLEDGLVAGLVAELSDWPGTVISSHKSAGQSFHKLNFLADLGLTQNDPGMRTIVERILAHQSAEGPFQLPMNIPAHFGGSGQDEWAWALCDAPLQVYALVKMGLGGEPAVCKSLAYLAGLVRENGWPCAVSKELGKFRGPGRKEDPCPFANLAMLKALSVHPDWRDAPASHTGAETLLTLWTESVERHPYMFFMGNDFRKLKAPFIWYDLLHVLDVLTQFTWLRTDARLLDMAALLRSKMDSQGCFTIESVWTAWKDWEFGQKKVPSRWLTLCAWRILDRLESA
ncbi:MAG: hypothetical protein HY835_04090 [Anaerolineae bacterium]|nr:hypothetical protein [Anaerolineae bacterium]